MCDINLIFDSITCKIKSLEWRRMYRIDYIESEYKIPEVFQKYFPAGLMGQDKKKNPGNFQFAFYQQVL